MEGFNLGLRKGAWTKEEDELLKQCIENHGEGKWHQVPHKSGLNRCRKSCRLRWLNYLKPNIKRGHFTEDEVDLMFRLHKLLGNRWTLIAGRLSGRTANDVKNYWNTRLRTNSHMRKMKDKSYQTTRTVVIRPQPRNLKNSRSLISKEPGLDHTLSKENASMLTQTSPPIEHENDWWQTLLDDKNTVESTTCSCLGLDDGFFTSFWADDIPQSARCVTFDEEGLSGSDFSLNVDLWNHAKEVQRK